MNERTVLILSGSGRYADPWHPYKKTSASLIELAEDLGLRTELPLNIDAALTALANGPLPDLVIANLGRPQDGNPSPATRTAAAGLQRVLSQKPLLALHSAASAFVDSEAWTTAVGARWQPGVSWHPDQGVFQTLATPVAPDILPGAKSFTLDDERYLDFQQGAADRRVLFEHEDEDGGRQPAIWVQERNGVRSAYDAYGHDQKAYRAPEHRTVIRQLLRWLTGTS